MRAVVLALAGCGAPTLVDTTIQGGTAEQRAEVRAAIADFERDTGGGRVVLAGVRFGRISAAGHYDRIGRQIAIHEDLDHPYGVMIHELCHALDFQEDLLDGRDNPVEPLVDEVLVPENRMSDHPLRGPRKRRSEAFAGYCHQGPTVAELLAAPCPDEPAEVTEVARWVRDEVWRGADPLPEVERAPATASWTAAFAPDRVWATPTDAPGVIGLTLDHHPPDAPTRVQWALVDLATGGWVPPGEIRTLDLGWVEGPDLPPLVDVVTRAGFDGGPVAWKVEISTYVAPEARRLLWWDGDTVASMGCLQPASDLVAADGRIWLVEAEGTQVTWSPLGE